MTWPRLPLVFTILIACGPNPLCAQREIVVPAPAASIPSGMVQVVLPNALCAAVSDTQSILVMGHKALNNQHLTVYKLDPNGKVSASPTRIALPRADSLKEYDHYPLALAFHPTLPLLYVWQDINERDVGVTNEVPVFKDFNHLIVYAVKDGALQLAESHARGPEFSYRNPLGSIGFSPDAKRLFLPNVRALTPESGYDASVGYFRLNANGMPIKEDSAAARPVMVTPMMSYPIGTGFASGSSDTVMFGCYNGPSTWDLENRRGQVSWCMFRDVNTPCLLTGHPKLPFVYTSTLGAYFVHRMEHVDGYLTMLPHRIQVDGAAFQSAPVFMTKPNKLAVGSVNAIYLLSLETDGRFSKTVEMGVLTEPVVRGLVYSEKFDRLYVAVGEAK